MKKTTLFATLLCLAQSSLHADVPTVLNYQGKVADSTGLPIGATGTATTYTAAPVNRKIIFRLYSAATGGTPIWTEEQTATISSGVFSVLLGNGIAATGLASGGGTATLTTEQAAHTDLSAVFAGSTSRYLEIVVDDGTGAINSSDVPISPRQQITSTAFAFHAKVADGITSGSDLTINPVTGTAANYGLGWYGTGRLFNSVAVDGPVLYGNSGGALGSAVGSTKNIAVAWNASGQVGIGATSSFPTTNKLTLQGDDATTPAQQLVIQGSVTSERLAVGYDTTLNQATLQSYTAASTAGPLLLNPSGGNVLLTSSSGATGNVGIGTSTPGVPLNFANILGDKIALWGSSGNTYGFGMQAGLLQIHTDGNGGDVAFGYGSSSAMTETMRIKGSGKVGIGTNSPAASLQVVGGVLARGGAPGGAGVNNNGYAFSGNGGDNDSGMFSSADGQLEFHSNSTEAMRITNGGNVGIGNTTPGAKLSIGTPIYGSTTATTTSGAATLSTTFVTGAGALGQTAGNELLLGNFGFSSPGNNQSLAISAYRTLAGATWSDTALILGMNVDVTARSGAWLSLHSNSNVGIGTATPSVKLDVAGDIKASGDIKSNGKSVPVAEESNLRIVRGTVSSTGTVLKGSGFTATRTSLGYYSVTFTTAFSDTPTVTCSSINQYYICNVQSPTASGFLPLWMNNGHVATDCDFNFIAIGPR